MAGYPGSQAQAGRGTTLGIGATPTLIGELSDLPLNRGKWNTVETTNFDSGSDAEYLSTVRKAATITLKGNRVSSDAGQVAVEAAYQAGTRETFVVTLPKTSTQTTAGDTYTFEALVVSCDFSIQTEKQVEFSIELQVTGATTFTAGS